ncbi:hypothetical protein K435DRAFT_851008 [Dendrothele bispora CBS 962.96]|uniref:Uncharacterized protein n=1 Tax=Dendrothele bispora (strain CBS 962.96) TaxID=1314807 RepID=A0A4S8MNH9_DENBC|nr:hypothetical protein K435DRAFT_851008 [Dendrothele bispora CBS 962.96]
MKEPKITTHWGDSHNRHIIQMLATHNPGLRGRLSMSLWSCIADTFPNDTRGCTARAWQAHYDDYKAYFDQKIEEYIRLGRHPEPPKSTTPVQTRYSAKQRESFTTEEKNLLVSFLAVNGPKGRVGITDLQRLMQNHPSAARRTALSWYTHYYKFKDYYDHQIQEYQKANGLSVSRGSVTSIEGVQGLLMLPHSSSSAINMDNHKRGARSSLVSGQSTSNNHVQQKSQDSEFIRLGKRKITAVHPDSNDDEEPKKLFRHQGQSVQSQRREAPQSKVSILDDESSWALDHSKEKLQSGINIRILIRSNP